MLSTRARDAMRKERGGARLRVFVCESIRDAASLAREQRVCARAAARVGLGAGLAAGLAGSLALARTSPREAVLFLGWCAAGGAMTALLAAGNAGLFAPERTGCRGIGPANALTLVRFALVAPTVCLLLSARYSAALAVYGLLVTTDVVDGIIARVRGERSRFGVVMDPLADVASTFGVFTAFAVDNLVPLWLYLLLVARYAMLLVGSLVLFLAAGPIEFRSTVPGKIVGVVQAAGAGWIMLEAQRGSFEPDRSGPLFALLGVGFASIVGSQAVIGWRHIRGSRSRAGG
jgi:cardiolipin synthase